MQFDIFFKALNDKTRRDILELLKKGDLSAGEIAEKFQMSWPSISHHLELLKRAGLIEADKRGQYIYYTLNTTVMDEIMKWMMQFKKTKKTK